MSGGHFDHRQWCLNDIAEEVEHVIKTNDSTEKDGYGQDMGYHFPPEVIERFKAGARVLRIAYIYAHEIDWLLSSDTGPDTFVEGLDERLKEVEHQTAVVL